MRCSKYHLLIYISRKFSRSIKFLVNDFLFIYTPDINYAFIWYCKNFIERTVF